MAGSDIDRYEEDYFNVDGFGKDTDCEEVTPLATVGSK